MEIDNSIIFLFVNILIYILFAWYTYKRSWYFSASTFIVTCYAVMGFCSILFYNHPLTIGTEYMREIHLLPLIYFASITIFMVKPIIEFEQNIEGKIRCNNIHYLIWGAKIIFFIQILAYISYFPIITRNALGNFGDMRNDAAMGELGNNLTSAIPHLLIVANDWVMSLRNIVTIIAFYLFFASKKRTFFLKAFFVSSLLYPMYMSYVHFMRSLFIVQLLYIVFLIIIFRKFISDSLKKKITLYGGILIIGIVLLMISISNSRFGTLASWMYYKYAGETFVNFSGQLWSDLNGSTDGYAYFTWFGSFWGMQEHFSTMLDKWHYIASLTNIDAGIFYGYIGGLVIEFGWSVTFIAYLLLSIISNKLIRINNEFSLSRILIIGFIANTLIYGMFIFPYQAAWGNRELVLFLLMYIFVRFQESKKVKYSGIIS